MSKHILLVDDDPLLRTSLAFNLTRAGYRASAAASAEDGLARAEKDIPALILLDVSLPGMDGFQALGRFRETVRVPVILLTADADELDQAWGLSNGADDYVTKPFSFTVLLARIEAALRRSDRDSFSPHRSIIEVGDLRIDAAAHQVFIRDRAIELRPREFDLLVCLARHADTPVTTEDLIHQVWGPGFAGESQVVYVTISRLREKLEDNPDHPRRLLLQRGMGYKLALQSQNGI